MYRTTALAFLLFNGCVRNVIADGISLVDDNLAIATTTMAGSAAAATSNLIQSIFGLTDSKTNTQSAVGVASASSTLSEINPAPTNHAATLELSTSFQNKTFLPLEIDGHEVPISCLNCSTTGTLHVTGSGLSVNEDAIGGNNTHLFDGGIFTALLPHGLKGRIELGLSAPSSLSHTFNLSKVPITGFAIPGVADAGVTADIGIRFSLQLSKPSDVSFGFDFEIPDHSSILIDLANEKKSSVSGFGIDKEPNLDILRGFGNDRELRLNILPVNVSDPSLDVKLSTALFLDLTIGADLHDSDVVAEIGAQLVIPVNIEERQLSQVDSKCNPLSHKTSTGLTTRQKPATTTKSNLIPQEESHSLLGDYTNIIPSIGMEMNVFVAAGLQDSLGTHDLALNTALPLFSTASTLPTTCINNHKTTSVTTKAAATTTQNGESGPPMTHGRTDGSPASTASSAAVASLSQGGFEDALLLMGSSAAFALAVAMGWFVVNF